MGKRYASDFHYNYKEKRQSGISLSNHSLGDVCGAGKDSALPQKQQLLRDVLAVLEDPPKGVGSIKLRQNV